MTLDDLLDSYEYAEWITSHSIEYDIIVSNGESLIEAMHNETMIEAYLKHIGYDGEL